jgi:glycosyltransferase involved in cell wall biosynthesis
MISDYTYTIAVCNYNMANTLEESMRSVLNQIDDRFEVLVVDGGSDDGSIDILQKLEDEYSSFRYISLPKNDSRRLGKDRDISVKEARGEYVLLHIDADDKYEDGLLDYVNIYHQIESQIEQDFGMRGSHITMAPRDYILELGSYPNVSMAEDLDLWGRMAAEDALITIECEPFWKSIGYEYDLRNRVKRRLKRKTSEFQLGRDFEDTLKEDLHQDNFLHKYFNLSITLIAYFNSVRREEFNSSKGITDYYESEIQRMTIPELEKQCGIDIDMRSLSDKGRQIFSPSSA